MKKSDEKMILALVFATVASFQANAQPRLSQATTGTGGVSTNVSTRSGGSYVSGGERGSVVQVVRDVGVQAELNLSGEQLQRISDILGRVQAMESELFEDFRRHQTSQRDGSRARSEQRLEKLEEARRQLAAATKSILERLTPTQQNQLKALCREAAADEAGFQARMSSNPRNGGGGGFGPAGGGGGGFGNAGGSGGPTPGTASPIQSFRSGQPGAPQRPMSSGPGAGGFGGGGGGGGSSGGSTNAGPPA